MAALLAAEAVFWWAAGWAAEGLRQEAWREFSAAARGRREVDKVPYGDIINRQAAAYGVDARLVAGIIRAESSFEARAVSGAGAAGLMQVSPGTWREVNAAVGACRGRHAGDCGPACFFDAELNVRVGTAYFAGLLRQYGGDPVRALAAYNAGPGAVAAHGGVPPYPETREYVGRVMVYWYSYSGMPPPGPGRAADRLEAAGRLAGWAVPATGAAAAATAAGLRRRHRSWRWR